LKRVFSGKMLGYRFASWRTNLVLANAVEVSLVVLVELFGPDGEKIGSREVTLPPLGMTQISHVARELGAGDLTAGRIAVSTPTTGGTFAAYASLIDNATNDPRSIQPR